MEQGLQNEERNWFQTTCILRFIQVKRNGSISQQWLTEQIHDNKIKCTRHGLGRRKYCGWDSGEVHAVENQKLSKQSTA